MRRLLGLGGLALILALSPACTSGGGETGPDPEPDPRPQVVCGDGEVGTGEACDDGNTTTETCDYGETSCTVCDASCQSVPGATSLCGDGSTDTAAGESCDDGNTVTEVCAYGETGCTVCDASCQLVAGATQYCGDGVVDEAFGEACDDGNQDPNDDCSTNCQPAECGNGILEGSETCDDGNTTTETCTYGETSCTVCDASCQSVPGEASYCGDQAIQADQGETCDDGNQDDTDACLNTCQAASCGDGAVQAGVEVCDDGNTVLDDCAYGEESCTVCGPLCTQVPGVTSWCGDGVVDSSNEETCDDGNTYTDRCDYGIIDCPVCSFACQDVQGFTHYCGDGDMDWVEGESCDDGNTDDGDYCSAGCIEITGFCGDGLLQDNEVCDDANTLDDDYCSADCTLITGACGDGTIQGNEACDDGNQTEGDYCSADCTELTGFCSDGILQTNEVCDDGNLIDGDYCDAQCLAVTGACGDGVVQTNEACDDGNLFEGDYCAAACTAITGRCGDGVVQSNEVCDDGNYEGGDLCSADCTVAVDNLAPTLVAVPDQSVVAGGCLALVVEASDLGDDPLSFSLDVAPAGMSIDAVTGLLTWYPEASQVGSYNAVVRVSDGGLSDTTQVALTVSDASQDDKVAPVVAISGAKQVEPDAVIGIDVAVEDVSDVAAVVLKLGESTLGSLDVAPYHFDVNAPLDAGVVTSFELEVTDVAGNTTRKPWDVTTVQVLEADPPVIESIRTPNGVVAGTTFTTAAVVSDATGVKSVAVYQGDTLLSEATAEPFALTIALSTTTPTGPLSLVVRAEDYTGLVTEQPWVLQVVASVQTGSDAEPELQAPSRVMRGQTVQVTATALGDDVASVALWLEGTQVAVGYGNTVTGDVVMGEARVLGETVRMRAVATSFDGVARDAFACLKVVESLSGFVYGTVLHDDTGHPAVGATVRLTDALGGQVLTETDAAGRYQLGVSAGAYRVQISGEGGLDVWRPVVARADALTRVPDARLTPVVDVQAVPAIGDVTMLTPPWRWEIPSGALLGLSDAALSHVTPQGLPAPLPHGYAPVHG